MSKRPEIKYFGLDLDRLFDDLFFEMERVQDGRGSHTIAMLGTNRYKAAASLANQLIHFLSTRMYPSDEYGQEKE